MTHKYYDYIELSPGYESVVDEKTEERQEGYWRKYIVNDDIVKAIEKVYKSLRRENDDVKRSFWFHGTYGTGKTYSALVFKHLLEDDIPEVESFFSRPPLAMLKNKFIGLRKKGKYLVVWKSGGCSSINNTERFLLEIENSIKTALQKKGYNYMGRKSIVQAIQGKIKDPSNNWDYIFNDPVYDYLAASYESVEAFKAKVLAGDMTACDLAARVISQKGWGLVCDDNTFKSWIKDIIEGNGLEDTGIVFIWDEFTEYLKNSNGLDILRVVSEFCKEAPLYMMFIVHKHSGLASDISEDTYAHMVHRYHEVAFSIHKETAYKLMGDSIIVRPGMENNWADICESLYDSIRNKVSEFVGLDEIDVNDIKSLMPIHPMTVSLISEVAGNFAASQRTLFRFLKDKDEGNENAGFIHYIRNNGPEDWKWLTPDMLWDYFFLRDSDVRGLGEDAVNCLRHYNLNKDRLINSPNALKIFKVAMLLIAITGTTKALMQSNISRGRGIKPTVSTLVNCFAGQLDENTIRTYLNELKKLEIIITIKDGNDYRLERPFLKEGGSQAEFDAKKKDIIKKNTIYMLTGSDGVFGNELKGNFLPQSKAIVKRIEVEPCYGDKSSINIRLPKLKDRLLKYPYKFGLLVLIVSDNEHFLKAQEDAARIAKEDDTERLIVVVLKKPLDDEILNEWYENQTWMHMAGFDGKGGSAQQFEKKSEQIVSIWANSAAGGQMIAYYKDSEFPTIFNNNNLVSVAERTVIELFSAAPETLVPTITAYKSGNTRASLAAITKDSGKNRQIKNIADAIKAAQVWDIEDPQDFKIDGVGPATKSIALLYTFINKQLSDNVKISLTDLWDELQKPPFGYYDTLVCHYLLGFIMRFLINKDYSWFDGSNSVMLNPESLSVMISKMCKGDTHGHTLSAGSEAERLFRLQTKSIFLLDDNEVANEEQARKNVRAKIVKNGLPFWVLKYIDEDKFCGLKSITAQIIDKYCEFINQEGNQNDVIEDILDRFKGNGKAKEILADCFNDKTVMYEGLNNYLKYQVPELLEEGIKYGFSITDIFDAIKFLMQAEIWAWKEAEVTDKLEIVFTDICLIGFMNSVIQSNRKTLDRIKEDLRNKFDHMKVPGVILENHGDNWCCAVKALRDISLNKWIEYDLDTKKNIIDMLIQYADEAWRHITDSREVLEKYLEKLGYSHSKNEITSIHSELSVETYEQSENGFKTQLLSIRKELEYEKIALQLEELWKIRSDSIDVVDWSNKNGTPIHWVLPNCSDLISVLKSCSDNSKRELSELKETVKALQNEKKWQILRNKSYIDKCFIDFISHKYSGILTDRLDDLRSYLRMEVKEDVYTWNNRIPDIRKYTEKYILTKMRDEVITKAQNRIRSMSDKDLRQRFNALIEKNPEMCMYIIED